MNLSSILRWFGRLVFALSLFCGALVRAQEGAPVTVYFSGAGASFFPFGAPPSPGTLTLTVPELATSSNPGNPGRGNRVSAGSFIGNVTAPWTDVRMEIGRIYHLTVSTNNMQVSSPHFELKPPPNYRMEIEGVERTTVSMAASGSYAIRVVPATDEPPARAGSAKHITSGRLSWSAALGALPNGTTAGSLLITSSGYNSDWSSLFTPEGLTYSRPPGPGAVLGYRSPTGVSSPYIPGALRQVYANEAFADIVPLSTTSYEIRFYDRASVSGSGFPYDFSGKTPFIVYLIEKPSGTSNKLQITSKTYDGSGYPSSPQRTAVSSIERTGTWPAYTWTTNDWNTSGQSQLVQDVRTGTSDFFNSNSDYGYTTNYVLKNPTSSQVAEEGTNSYKMFNWGEELIATRRGASGSGLDTTFDYYTDSSDFDSYSRLKSVSSSNGSWEAYEYYGAGEGGTTYGGMRIHRPYLNSPAPSDLSAHTSGVITKYWYAPTTYLPLRLTKVETTTSGTLTGRTEFDYFDDLANFLANGWSMVRTNRYDSPESDSGKRLKTVTRHYRQVSYDGLVGGQILSIERPDNSKDAFIYQRGTWNGSSFATDGSARGSATAKASQVIVVHGTVNAAGASPFTSYNNYSLVTAGDSETDSFFVVTGRSTMEVTIRDDTSRVVRTEVRVWDGSNWPTVSSESYAYNVAGFLGQRSSSNGALYDASYTGEFKISEKDATGVVVNTLATDYDAAGRLLKSTREGSGSGATLVPSLQTTFEYDAASRVTKQTAGTTEQLISQRAYDTAGRLISQSLPGTGTTGIAYDASARTRTITTPTGKTSVETVNADGSLASVTGTGVIPRFFTRGIETDGRRYTRVNVATSTNVRKAESWTDWLGRTVKTVRPGFAVTSQPDFVEESFYDLAGHLVRTTRSGGYADLLYVYDSFGRLQSSGLDLTTSPAQTLDAASLDRFTESSVAIAPIGSDWWLSETSTRYLINGSAASPAVTTSRTRLSGFASGQLAESLLIDAEGGQTTQSITVDRANRVATTTITRTGLAGNAVEVLRNGLPASSTGFDGRTFTTQYDALLRPSIGTDSRTGATTTYYKSGTGLVDHITSPGPRTVSYEYDGFGRVIAFKNQDNKYSRTAYDDLSRPFRQWGEATSPAQLEYNEYGEQNKLTTWRGTDAIWSDHDWPSNLPTGVQQTTQWNYDAASGLLASKSYPAADAASPSSALNQPQSVTFNYNARGQTASRTWARGAVTNYGYSPAPTTGELTAVTHPGDAGSDVAFTYTRAGQIATATDTTGTRTFTYDATKPWRLDREELGGFYGNRWLSALYQAGTETNGMAGRDAGFQLGTSANRSSDLAQTWKFQSTGNLSAILSSSGGGAPRTFTYGYATNTSLPNVLSVTNPDITASPFSVARAYEPDRDLLTSIETTWSTSTVAKFAYGYTARGQRDWENRSGTAFAIDAQPVGIDYQYDDRGELTKALAYTGTNLTDPSKKLPNLQHEFAYDNAGNRTSANQTGDSARAETFVPDNVNQLSSRENKSVVAAGTSGSGVTVATRLDAGSAVAPDRQGSYWSKAFTPANTGGVAVANVSIYGANASNQALTELRASFVGGRTQAYDRDADGNMTGDGLWTYVYDAENRLTSMTATSAAVAVGAPNRRLEFRYDYLGRRVQKLILSDQGAGWVPVSARRYLYDGWNLVGEFDAPGGSSCGSLIRSYTWGLDSNGSFAATGGAGALLAINDVGGASPGTYLAAYDGNGNLAALYNASGSGAAAAIYEYSPFGELLRAEGAYAKENPFRFSTKFTDDETGLVNYGMRYYSPTLGRFVNRDPIEEAGGNNLMGFCGNDPISGIDMLGMGDETRGVSENPGGGMFDYVWNVLFNLFGESHDQLRSDRMQRESRGAQAQAESQAAKDRRDAQTVKINSIQSIAAVEQSADSLRGHIAVNGVVVIGGVATATEVFVKTSAGLGNAPYSSLPGLGLEIAGESAGIVALPAVLGGVFLGGMIYLEDLQENPTPEYIYHRNNVSGVGGAYIPRSESLTSDLPQNLKSTRIGVLIPEQADRELLSQYLAALATGQNERAARILNEIHEKAAGPERVWGAQHGGDRHWQRILQIVNAMERNGWRDIRINRQQVDVAGNVVGTNRPDISGINPRTGQRQNIEIDTSPASSERHRATVNSNDPNARNTFIVLPPKP